MKFDPQTIIIWIIIGLIAGWLASWIVGGGGIIRYILTGLIGSVVGGIIAQQSGINLGIGNPLAAQIVWSTIGAVVVVLIARILA